MLFFLALLMMLKKALGLPLALQVSWTKNVLILRPRNVSCSLLKRWLLLLLLLLQHNCSLCVCRRDGRDKDLDVVTYFRTNRGAVRMIISVSSRVRWMTMVQVRAVH